MQIWIKEWSSNTQGSSRTLKLLYTQCFEACLKTYAEYCECEVVSKVSIVLWEEQENVVHHEEKEVDKTKKMGPDVDSFIRPYECTERGRERECVWFRDI